MPTLAPFEHLAAFRDEMRSAGANWELDIYGGARHSFTGEGVLDQASPEAGLHPQSDLRSWRTALGFLTEVNAAQVQYADTIANVTVNLSLDPGKVLLRAQARQ